jgi:S1-C subfamily serine protease
VARLDLLEVLRLNRHAVALVWVENEFGEVSTGTAFAVRPDATLVTSRHVVAGEDGSLHPRRLAIQFSDSDQVWPARILTISTDEDLAIVKVDNILGDVPVARTFNTRPDTLEEGSIIASIGFPVGRNPSPRAAGVGDTFASPLLSAGVLLSTTSGRIEFQGYGAAGASGSPVFDANGSVIAVLSGGFSNEDPPRVVGVPFSAVAELLAELP